MILHLHTQMTFGWCTAPDLVSIAMESLTNASVQSLDLTFCLEGL